MNASLPIKSSSRAGRFKKKLVSEDFLAEEAPLIEERMRAVLVKFHQSTVSAAEFTAIYIITVLSHRTPGTWLGAKRSGPLVPSHNLNYPLEDLLEAWEPNIRTRLAGFATVGDLFANFAFKSTPISVNRSILNWSLKQYGLELMFRIPSPAEVLDQQKRGRRCVTVVLDKVKASKFILGERDSLGFTMHDLIHADHFYHNNGMYQGQLGFYGFLDSCMNQHHFDELLKKPEFESEFEYLIADMNAYAIHLMKCFKSALIHYQQNEQDFENWIQKLALRPEEERALRTLNSSDYSAIEQDQILLSFLSHFKWSESPLAV